MLIHTHAHAYTHTHALAHTLTHTCTRTHTHGLSTVVRSVRCSPLFSDTDLAPSVPAEVPAAVIEGGKGEAPRQV